MNILQTGKSWYKRISFQGLSIQQRLPLLICLLLSTVILTFSLVCYYGARKAAKEIGENRLRTMADQLGTMFSQSSQGLRNSMLATVKQPAVKKCMQSGGQELHQEAKDILNKLVRDSTWVSLELLDTNLVPVLKTGYDSMGAKFNTKTIFPAIDPRPDSFRVGKIYSIKDTMYYPVCCTISSGERVTGYLFTWRILLNTKQTLQQIYDLMGEGASLYVGNTDGSLWTDLVKPIAAPPVTTKNPKEFYEYNDRNGKKVIAALRPILTTPWILGIEFSEQTILETATRFWKWVLIAGSIFIALGIFFAWIMSRNIIKPVNQLTAAATAIAAGNYSSSIQITRLDELGKLSHAFNEMTQQVKLTQEGLEKKVKERTVQLETANKELEAFSYSVSHDLRSPLRGISGFAAMLEEQYGSLLDEDGKRLLTIITGNTERMGNLIDGLLAFARTGRQEILKMPFSTNEMVGEIISDPVIHHDKNISWVIHPLADSYGDSAMLRQVWINLISNAVKYSQHVEAPRIEIGSVTANGETSFFVKDNGVGFDPKYSGKLFKVFQRLHDASEFEGTGVGLAIVEKIISKHGGRVWVEAQKDVGATFYFSLPVSVPE